jgi:hypothetical protein
VQVSLDESLKIVDTVKWPVAAIVVALVIYFTLRPQIKALIDGLRKRGFKGWGAEATPEEEVRQLPTAAASPALTPLSADSPSPFELSDNGYFRSQVVQVTQRVAAINFASPEEKHKWLMREGAGAVVRADFEKLYRLIWASQMELLGGANQSGGVTHETALRYYDAAAQTAPHVYPQYTFDQWIGFLRGTGFIDVNADKYLTSEKGKLFIQFLVIEGYDLHGLYKDR